MAATPHNTKFEIYCKHTFWGETVAVCGASEVLGEWDPRRSLRLVTNTSIFPNWCSEEPVYIEHGTEYKFIILTYDDRVAWETPALANRTLPQDMPTGSCVFVSAHIERPDVNDAEVVTRSVRTFTVGKAGMGPGELRDIFDRILALAARFSSQQKSTFNRKDFVKAIGGSALVASFFGLPHSHQQEDDIDVIFQALDAAVKREVTWQDFHRFYAGFSPVLPSFENCFIDQANMVAATHNVKFEICCRHTYWGETLAVCGASPALGEWDPQKSLRLTTSPGTFPKWCSGPVNIEQGTAYKFVILQHDNNVWWETQKNRQLPQDIPSGSCVVVAAQFERPGVVFEAKFEISSVNTFKFGKPGMSAIELREAFDKIDAQQRGTINRRDLIKAIRGSAQIAAFFGLPQNFQQEDESRETFEAMFQAMDVTGSREVTWPDFHCLYVGFAPIVPARRSALQDRIRAQTPSVPCSRTALENAVTQVRAKRFERPSATRSRWRTPQVVMQRLRRLRRASASFLSKGLSRMSQFASRSLEESSSYGGA
eukprot:TRINITY_DN47639_c0_g1_i1.p1 TRINITY_DN47639_c0_g1~~TRINITY_DN47639_c0_g1_i1.p1  ORF type:complete len:540 (-),score=97.11 TRINITY_DN47639_c0_g1_i1:27-1646(-)